MQRSEEIVELVGALNKFQAAITSVKKEADNPFFHAKYADLDSVWDMLRKPLTENGLAVTQTTETSEDKLFLLTTLFHTSGQWMNTQYPIVPMKQRARDDGGGWIASDDPQSLGSAITYARRYSLSALLGVSSGEPDDDGEKAMARDKPQQAGKQTNNSASFLCPEDGKPLKLQAWGRWTHPTGKKYTGNDGKEKPEYHSYTPEELGATLPQEQSRGVTQEPRTDELPPEVGDEAQETEQGFGSVGELMDRINKTYRLTTNVVCDILGLDFMGQMREKYPDLNVAWEKIVAKADV